VNAEVIEQKIVEPVLVEVPREPVRHVVATLKLGSDRRDGRSRRTIQVALE
jgi:hypothetical protein